MKKPIKFTLIILVFYLFYWLLFAPLAPEKNRKELELPENILRNSGQINLVKPNSHKISGNRLDRARLLFKRNGIDVSDYRIVSYGSSDVDKYEYVTADYVINNLPVVGEGIYSYFSFENGKLDDRANFVDEDEYTEKQIKLLTIGVDNIPEITPIEALNTARKFKDESCDISDMFQHATEDSVQMELVYSADRCYDCENENFHNLPYFINLAWIIHYVDSTGDTVAIDAHTGDTLYGYTGIIDCGGM